MSFNRYILKGNVKGTIGDPLIQRNGFLALQRVVLTLMPFVRVLGMPYYQEGCDLWAYLGSIVLNLSFISYESV